MAHSPTPAVVVDLDALDAWLLSEDSPETSMVLSDMDGFLTGIIVGPEPIPPTEWLALILAIGLVLSAEALNTAIERMVDRVEPQWHPAARDAKDLAAAGVLIASVFSFIVGVILFGARLVSEASRLASGH